MTVMHFKFIVNISSFGINHILGKIILCLHILVVPRWSAVRNHRRIQPKEILLPKVKHRNSISLDLCQMKDSRKISTLLLGIMDDYNKKQEQNDEWCADISE